MRVETNRAVVAGDGDFSLSRLKEKEEIQISGRMKR